MDPDLDDEDLDLPKNFPFRLQDRVVPIANVARIMKNALPEASSGKISKHAKTCMQECVSEFISFVTSEATERCLVEKRKTVSGEDLITSLQTLGFDNYVEPLRVYLARYRDLARKKSRRRGRSEGLLHSHSRHPPELYPRQPISPSLPPHVQELDGPPPAPPPVPPPLMSHGRLIGTAATPWSGGAGVPVYLPPGVGVAAGDMRLQDQRLQDSQQQLLASDPSLFLRQHPHG